MNLRVIVVEDEEDLCDTLCRYLGRCGMDVRGAGDAETMWRHLQSRPVDVIVLDVNLPGESGFDAAARLRESSSVGLVMLTARGMREDRLHGLDLGADHYLVKPVDLQELESVIRNLGRRIEARKLPAPPIPATGRWLLDRRLWTLTPPGLTPIPLSGSEFLMLSRLGVQPGVPVSRSDLLAALCRSDLDPYRRNLDTTVSRLRRKVESAGCQDFPVRSARSIGYVFAASLDVTADSDAD